MRLIKAARKKIMSFRLGRASKREFAEKRSGEESRKDERRQGKERLDGFGRFYLSRPEPKWTIIEADHRIGFSNRRHEQRREGSDRRKTAGISPTFRERRKFKKKE